MNPKLVKERQRFTAKNADNEMLEMSDELEPPAPTKRKRGLALKKQTAIK